MSEPLPNYLLAAMPAVLRLEGEFVVNMPGIEASADGSVKARTFGGVGYSGGLIRQWWSRWPVLVDLSAMDVSRQQIPLQYAHDSMEPDTLLGQSDRIVNDGNSLQFSGAFYPDGKLRDHVVARADQGHKWQFSIGADPHGIQFVEAGTKVSINGREWTGPINVIRPSTLRELSVVRLGADPQTSALVAQWAQGGSTMAANANTEGGGQPSTTPAPATVAAGTTSAPVQAATQTTAPAPEAAPVAAGHSDGGFAALQAQVEASKQTIAAMQQEIEKMHALQATRDGRPAAPAIHASGSHPPGVNDETIAAAALCLNAGMSDESAAKHFARRGVNVDDMLQAAYERRRSTSLCQLLIEAARKAGVEASGYRIDHGNAAPILKAAFSTHSISNVLSTAFGKFVLEGWGMAEDVWRRIFQRRIVNDYKEINGIRAMGDFRFKPVTNAGKIQDASMSDEVRTIKADLWARMSSLTLQDITNDDQGVLSTMGTALGEGGILALTEDFWTTFLADNATYYTAPSVAAGNALSITSLDSANALFVKQKDAAQRLLGIKPNILLVPPELETAAMELMKGSVLITGENKTRPAVNVFAGRYEVLSSAYLTSATNWWMIGTRGTLAPMEVAFLQGQETPTIQSAEADFNTLGIQFRGYMAWGCKKAEKVTCVAMRPS